MTSERQQPHASGPKLVHDRIGRTEDGGEDPFSRLTSLVLVSLGNGVGPAGARENALLNSQC